MKSLIGLLALVMVVGCGKKNPTAPTINPTPNLLLTGQVLNDNGRDVYFLYLSVAFRPLPPETTLLNITWIENRCWIDSADFDCPADSSWGGWDSVRGDTMMGGQARWIIHLPPRGTVRPNAWDFVLPANTYPWPPSKDNARLGIVWSDSTSFPIKIHRSNFYLTL